MIALVMALTVFVVPTGAVYADDEGQADQTAAVEQTTPADEDAPADDAVLTDEEAAQGQEAAADDQDLEEDAVIEEETEEPAAQEEAAEDPAEAADAEEAVEAEEAQIVLKTAAALKTVVSVAKSKATTSSVQLKFKEADKYTITANKKTYSNKDIKADGTYTISGLSANTKYTVVVKRTVYGSEPTTDTTINTSKTYYTRTGEAGNYVYTKVTEPIEDQLSNYYEATTESVSLTAYTKVKKPKVKKVTAKKGLKSAKVKWSKVKNAKKYVVYINGKKKATVKGSKTSATVKGLKKLKTYKVYVKAYPVKGSNQSAVKSDTKKFKVYGTVDKYHYYDKKGVLYVDKKMCQRVNDKSNYSKTRYFLICNRDKTRVCIYKTNAKKKNGKYNTGWKLHKYWICGTGKDATKSPKTNTLAPGRNKGHFNGKGYRKNGKDRIYTCWYATRFNGACYFHSEVYNNMSKSSKLSSGLGRRISHGCIRLWIGNAKWIYNNIKPGSRMIVYEN